MACAWYQNTVPPLVCTENGHGHKCDLVIVSLGVILKLFYISNLLGERTDFSQGKVGF